MTLNSKFIITCGAVFTALSGMAYGAWQFGDYTGIRPIIKLEFVKFRDSEFKMAMDQAEQNTLAITRQEFNYIEDKKDRGVDLTWEEKRDYCKGAQILGYPVEGCTKEGEPVLIERAPDPE